MGRIYLPFEDTAMRPTFGPILPGTPHPTIVGNPHLRGGPFVALPGYGMEAAEAGTNLVVDPDFPDLTNWDNHGMEGGETIEVGPQFAMDQGEFISGLHIDVDGDDEGQRQPITIADATDYTASVWVYVLSGTGKLVVDKGDTSYASLDSTKIKEWERLEVPFTSTGTAGLIYLVSEVNANCRFWMPQLETGTYAKPARVGAQPASGLYVPSPISETQTPWSIACVVTPDWDHDGAGSTGNRRVWSLFEDSSNEVSMWYNSSNDKWYLSSRVGGLTSITGAEQSFSREDKIHLAATCDGYNAYLYENGVQVGPLVMGSVQPPGLYVGCYNAAAANPFNGVVDDFAFIHGCLPEFRVQKLYRASLRGIPLHGVLESLS